jgi:hypothetical protein
MRWDLKNADSGEVERLAAELSSQPVLQLKDPRIASTLARLLVMRGITEAEAGKRFLTPELAHLHSPYLMAGMDEGAPECPADVPDADDADLHVAVPFARRGRPAAGGP